MNDRKVYWQNRLSNPLMRAAWLSEVTSLGLFADVRATDVTGHTDEYGTHYLIGRRTPAVEQWEETKRLVPELWALALAESVSPPAKGKEKAEDGNAD